MKAAAPNSPDLLYRARWRAINTFERLALGQLAPNVTTPRDIAFMWDQSILYEYELPHSRREYDVPVLIVPPLMVKPTIFDLRPGHSMVGNFCQEGFHTFMLDFGVPTDADRHIRVDDYVMDFIPNAVRKICERTGSDTVSLVGWSMGGIMSYAFASLDAAGAFGTPGRVRNVVTIGSPFDFSKMFPFNYLARFMKLPPVRASFQRLGNIPPSMTKTSFKLLDPIKTVRRYADVVVNYWDRDWIIAYESMAGWADDFIPYPGDAFMQFVTDFVMQDKLRKGEVLFGGEVVDMNRFASNLLVVIGTTDKVAPIGSVQAGYDVLPSADKSKIDVPLGHIGLISGSRAPQLVWNPVCEWLATRSNAQGQ